MERAANGTEFSQKSFQIWKLLNFWNANHLTENSRNSGSKLLNGKKLIGRSFRKFVSTSWGCPPFENFGKCCYICYWKLPKFKPDVLVEWKAPYMQIWAAWTIMSPFGKFYSIVMRSFPKRVRVHVILYMYVKNNYVGAIQ